LEVCKGHGDARQVLNTILRMMMLRWRLLNVLRVRRRVTSSLLEYAGIALILGSLWVIKPIVCIVVLGGLMLLLAQGITEGRDDT
jgi:hypothetical protein